MFRWYGALVTGVVVVLLGQYLAFYLNRRRDRYERLMERYAEFAGIVAEDLERAKSVDSAMAFMPSRSDKPKFEAWLEGYEKLEKQRHHHRGQVARLRFQISILDKNGEIVDMLHEVCNAQPTLNALQGLHDDNYDKQLVKHEHEIESYSEKIEGLLRELRKR